jgi:hypothetical protein
MPSTYSPSLRIELIGSGEQSGVWGTTTNNNLGALIEQAITGRTTVDVTAGNATLTSLNGVIDEARSAVLAVIGTPGVTRIITIPNVAKLYTVQNATANIVQIKTSSGTAFDCPPLSQSYINCDGSDVVTGRSITDGANAITSLAAPFASPTFTGTTTVAALTDSGNLNFTGIGNRITGDTTNATVTNRLALQDSTTNAQTIFSVFPNGTSTQSQVQLYNSSSGTNYTRFNLISFPTSVALTQTISGTGTYLPMTFSTSASEAMRLDTSGNLGIGTSSPQNRLNVYGSGTGGAAQTTLLLSHLDGASGSQSIRLGSYQSGASVIGGAYLRALYNYASSTATSLAFVIDNGTSAAEAMRIDSSGNVGIGTSSPIGYAGYKTLTINDTTGSNVELTVGGTRTGALTATTNAMTLYGIGAATPLVFNTNAAERMRLDTSGNVGIGTASPATRLEVATGGDTDMVARAGTTASYASIGARASDYLSLPSFTNTALFQSGSTATGTTVGLSNASLGRLQFINCSAGLIYTNGGNPLVFGTSSAERMRIDSSGNVGIGTASPGSRLDVVGTGGGATPLTVRHPGNSSFGTAIQVKTTAGTDDPVISLENYNGGSPVRYGISCTDNGSMAFLSGAYDVAFGTERMRIDSSGNVAIANLTASQAVFTNASKELVSNAITGTGSVVMSTSPTLVTPALGTPSALVGTNITGTAAGLTAGNVTTNANLTGAITSVGNATSLGSFSSANLAAAVTDETGSGALVFATSPTLVAPALGTPASGVVTNLTGTASININGTVGATTANSGSFTTLAASSPASFAAGTASLPAITRTGDTNTGMWFPAADTIAFSEGGAEAMRLDSSGNVGIGTSSPSAKLDVQGSVGTSTPLLVLKNTSTASASNIAQTQFFTGNSFGGLEQVASITGINPNAGVNNGGALYFSTSANGTATTPTERMRIDSSGNLMVGRTSAIAKLSLQGNGATDPVFYVLGDTAGDVGNGAVRISKFDNDTTTSQIFVQFLVNNTSTGSGQINANGASQAAFGSFSDSRLKENIVDLPSQLENIMALRPVEFDYIQSEGGGHQIGFIAQEMQEVYSDAVGERSDGMLTVTGWNKTEAILVKAIQELKAVFDAYKATHP